MSLPGPLLRDLRNALAAALPSRSDWRILLREELDVRLDELVAEQSALLDLAFTVLKWAESRDRVPELVEAALRANPTNRALRQAHVALQAHLDATDPPPDPATPGAAIGRAARDELVPLLLRLPLTATFAGRGALLAGIPAHLNRDEGNARRDLLGVVEQLHRLGRLSGGAWPLLQLIDNALGEVPGYELADDLRRLQRRLAELYAAAG